jgi:uncharacterized protein YqeY
MDPAEQFTTRLRADLKAAMQARQTNETRTLRALIGAIDNAQSIPVADGPYQPRAFGDPAGEVPRRTLSEADLQALLRHEVVERRAVADEIERFGQAERAAALRAEAVLVERYLAA